MESTNLKQMETLLGDFQLSRDFRQLMLYSAEKSISSEKFFLKVTHSLFAEK